MHPIFHYNDPHEGFIAQLTPLKGLVKIVPPLIDADRQLRWDNAGGGPGDGDSEQIDVYESESGPEENWGFADYASTLYSTAVVTAWEAFHVYLVRHLRISSLSFELRDYPVLQTLVQEEVRRWDRRFEDVVKRYDNFAAVKLTGLESWNRVKHIQTLRNALVHNLGLYTSSYLKMKDALRYPQDDYLERHLKSDDQLINSVAIPLTQIVVERILDDLLSAAKEVNEALQRT